MVPSKFLNQLFLIDIGSDIEIVVTVVDIDIKKQKTKQRHEDQS